MAWHVAIYGSNASGSIVGNYSEAEYKTRDEALAGQMTRIVRLVKEGYDFDEVVEQKNEWDAFSPNLEYRFNNGGMTRIVGIWEE